MQPDQEEPIKDEDKVFFRKEQEKVATVTEIINQEETLNRDNNQYEETRSSSNGRDGQTQTVENSQSPDYMQTLSVEQQRTILSRECSHGLENQGNDCFFNAAFQMLIHSSFKEFLMNKENLDNKTPNYQEFYKFIRDLGLRYHDHDLPRAIDQAVPYPKEEMRGLLSYNSGSQEDCAEALRRMFSFYELQPVCSSFRFSRQFDLKTISEIDAFNDPSELDGHRIDTIEFQNMIPIELGKGNDQFQTYVDQKFENRQMVADISFASKGKYYKAEKFHELLEPIELKDIIFFQMNRFDYDKTTQSPQKITTSLQFQRFDIKMNNQIFELQGFIVHNGSTPRSGHYVAYCRTSNGWKHFNDDKVESLDDESVLQRANDAYILCFQKKPI